MIQTISDWTNVTQQSVSFAIKELQRKKIINKTRNGYSILTYKNSRDNKFEVRNKEEYLKYLQTEHWKEVRTKKFKSTKYKCEFCGSTININAHHKNYKCLWKEKNEDLITLCKECHNKKHDIIPTK